MKFKSIAFACLIFIAAQSFAQQSKVETLQSFLGDVISLDATTINTGEPLVTVSGLAAEKAAKSIEITKENIESALATAKSYKTSIIIVGRHTIVKIIDLSDCVQSGAWGTCMPKGVGYIQKAGVLIEKEGYINNIIGIPDGQKRTLFLFNN